ncbi:phage tail tube protein, partial [Propionibacterium freudenreichii]|uniref:phage tail tube protein n=1 Tax=Propionibacterium freudenreichii TaxID=1744 RepID=UPI0038522FB3
PSIKISPTETFDNLGLLSAAVIVPVGAVGDILIDGVSQAGISCLTAFTFNWDNTMQLQRCLGGGINARAILEMLANGTGSFTAAW